MDEKRPSGWAIGYTLFAAILLMIAGGFAVLSGISALFKEDYYEVTGEKWVFTFNVQAWGWIHILLGIALGLVGYLLLRGNLLARIVAIFLAAGSALAYFAWLPYYPVWATIVIALNVLVIWALALHGKDITMTD